MYQKTRRKAREREPNLTKAKKTEPSVLVRLINRIVNMKHVIVNMGKLNQCYWNANSEIGV